MKKCLCIVISVLIFIAATASCGRPAETASADAKSVMLPVIMYHSVVKDSSLWNDYVISPETLRSDIEYLKENGYEFVLTGDLTDWIYCGKPLPEKCVMLTFDDGCYNFMTYVEPVLRETGAKAVLSVVGSWAEKAGGEPQSAAYSYLTYEQIGQLSKCGSVEIASHGYDMHTLDERRGALKKEGESDLDYQSAFISDLLLSIDGLEKNCGITPQCYAYPFGFVCEESLSYVKACRFQVSLGCEEKVNILTADPESLYCLGRFNRPSGVSTEEFMETVLGHE